MSCTGGQDSHSEVRSLFLNLKDKSNPGLRNEIVLGELAPDRLVSMSKDVSVPHTPLIRRRWRPRVCVR